MKYQQMLREVETIVESMNQPDLDLDQMVSQVERGFKLIESMRSRLQETQEKVDELCQSPKPSET